MVFGGGFKPPLKVIFFNAILYNRDYIKNPDEILLPLFGKPIIKTKEFPFCHTDYYVKEMGDNLFKYFAGYDIIDYPDVLVRLKHNAVDLEDNFKIRGKRILNVDPGYVALEKVVAASTKNFTHRAYMFDNIYADVQLIRRGKLYVSLPWTFYDYQKDFVLTFFDSMRKIIIEA
jgi:hypothetical protein